MGSARARRVGLKPLSGYASSPLIARRQAMVEDHHFWMRELSPRGLASPISLTIVAFLATAAAFASGTVTAWALWK